jgi:hypothetical protein
MEIINFKGKTLLLMGFAVLAVGGLVYFLQQKGFKPSSPGDYIDNKIENKVNQTKENKTGEKAEIPTSLPGVEFVSYPEDFPKDLMVVPANFEQSLRYKNPQGEEIISLTYVLLNNPKTVVEMYKTILGEAKWVIDQKNAGKVEILTVSKEKMRAEITIEAVEAGSSKVHLLYYPVK